MNELYHHGILGQKWGIRRFQNKDGTYTNAGKKRRNEVHEDYKNAHDRKSVKQMGDKELRTRINRLQMEKQYSDLKKQTSLGERITKKYIRTAGTIAGVAGATAIYKKYGTQALNKIGGIVL